MTTSGYTTHKFTVILNKNLETGVALNAAAHMAAGLVSQANNGIREQMRFIDFTDKDGGVHPTISALSLIVLRGTSNEIRKARNEAKRRNILFADFTRSMTGDTYVEQLERTQATPEAELEYYGICLFGEKVQLDEFTRKLSLWR
jgi:hypothetical protein